MNGSIYTLEFWKDLGERTLSTALQVLAGLVTVQQFINPSWMQWKEILATTLITTVYTVIKGLLASISGNEGTASFSTAVEPAPKDPLARVREALPALQQMVREEVRAVAPTLAQPDQIEKMITGAGTNLLQMREEARGRLSLAKRGE